MLFALASAAFTNKTGESQVLQAKTIPDTPTTNYTDAPNKHPLDRVGPWLDPDSQVDRKFMHASKETYFRLASVLGNGMVLASHPKQAMVWGFCRSDDEVKVLFNGHTLRANVAPDHAIGDQTTWRVLLPATEASFDPYEITVISSVSTDYNLTLSDVMFGDVWVCGGQSNMEYQMAHKDFDKECWDESNRDCSDPSKPQCEYGCVASAKEEIEAMTKYDGKIRMFQPKRTGSQTPTPDVTLMDGRGWENPSETNGDFSAVCWFFARDLFTVLSPTRPLGLISAAVGGTHIELWSSNSLLDDQCKESRKPAEEDSKLWNAMMVGLLRTTIDGAIWYQGEANTDHPKRYDCMFPAMIDDWRDKWHLYTDGQTGRHFPFGWAQLNADAPIHDEAWKVKESYSARNYTFLEDCDDTKECWDECTTDCMGHLHEWAGAFPGIRLAQHNALARVENSFMAVTIDTPGWSVHSPYKQPVGRRLARGALAVRYGLTQHHEVFPKLKSAKLEGGAAKERAVVITLDGVGKQGLTVIDGAPGFQVLGKCWQRLDTDWQCWHPVPIASHGFDTVKLTALPLKPQAVRYLWHQLPYGREHAYPGDRFLMTAPIFAKPPPLPYVASGMYYGLDDVDWHPLGPFISDLDGRSFDA